jgi:hypothetical protein
MRKKEPRERKKCTGSLKISVADPGSGAFFTPGSGIGKKIKIRIMDEYPGISESLESIFGVKNTFKVFLIRDPGWKNSDPGPEINIPDLQH